MGSESSIDNNSIRSSSSYYGDNGAFGEMTKQEIYETIDRNQGYYPRGDDRNPPQAGAKLKCLVSVSQPDPYIRSVNGNCFLCFGLKCDAFCTIEIAARGRKNTFHTDVCDRTELSVPIPVYTDFSLSIVPDMQRSVAEVRDGFVRVTKHVLNFTMRERSDGVLHTYASQVLHTASGTYEIPVGKVCRIVSSSECGKCCMCGTGDAQYSVSPCGHKQLCGDCLEAHSPNFALCPFCSAPK